jgi:beta-glucosidase
MTDWYASKKNQARHDLAIKAGNDLIMPGEASAKKEIVEAVKNGTLSEEELYSACYNVVKQVMGSALQKEYVEDKKNG